VVSIQRMAEATPCTREGRVAVLVRAIPRIAGLAWVALASEAIRCSSPVERIAERSVCVPALVGRLRRFAVRLLWVASVSAFGHVALAMTTAAVPSHFETTPAQRVWVPFCSTGWGQPNADPDQACLSCSAIAAAQGFPTYGGMTGDLNLYQRGCCFRNANGTCSANFGITSQALCPTGWSYVSNWTCQREVAPSCSPGSYTLNSGGTTCSQPGGASDSDGNAGTCPANSTIKTKHPINVGTGNKVLVERDIDAAGPR
jgi:hypothetical protein